MQVVIVDEQTSVLSLIYHIEFWTLPDLCFVIMRFCQSPSHAYLSMMIGNRITPIRVGVVATRWSCIDGVEFADTYYYHIPLSKSLDHDPE